MITINNTVEAPIKDIQVLGNTYQDPNALSRIVSVGEEQQDGQFKMSILSSNKNLDNGYRESGGISSTGDDIVNNLDQRTEFIKIDNISNIFISSRNKAHNTHIVLYDNNRKFVSRILNVGMIATPIPSNVSYVRAFGMIENMIDFQLEEGTQATPYVPHEEHKSSILLPCALEKVDNEADRLYHDGENWCIEKNTLRQNLKELAFTIYKVLTNSIIYQANIDNRKSRLGISNKFKYDNNSWGDEDGVESIGFDNSTSRIFLKTLKSNASSVTELIKYVEKDYIIHNTLNPQFIPLPKDQQITLNSFADKTHIYMISGEVEGTIKAKVSKSMGASVSANTSAINVLDKRVADIEGLKESQDMAYETDKGYLVCEGTKTGVVKDLELKGKTVIVDTDGNIAEAGTPNAILKSVGEDVDEIAVSSVNGDGNLFPLEDVYNTNLTQSGGYKWFVFKGESNTKYTIGSTLDKSKRTSALFKVCTSDYYSTIGWLAHHTISNISDTITFTTDNMGTAGFAYSKQSMTDSEMYNILESFVVSKGTTLKPYEPHQSNKKPLLYRDTDDTFKPVPQLREWDKIEDGKLIIGSGEVVLNGTDNHNWSIFSDKSNKIIFQTTSEIAGYDDVKRGLICDKFTAKEWVQILNDDNVEGICLMDSNKGMRLSISKSKLSTQDVAGFKKWLQSNPVTVVYKLATPQVYDLAPINLDSYENETLILCESGAIIPHMNFKMTSYIANLVASNKERINRLEKEVYKYQVTQNRMMLDSRYMSDQTTFKVDYFANAVDERTSEIDEDLFNLIVANILVGKDNYNYDKMIVLMDFYVTVGLIDWDMWDKIFLLMELQHNPPVEEIPPVEEPIVKTKKKRK